jgi:RNA recognition motif-containing protein
VAKDAQRDMCRDVFEVAVGSEGSGLRVVLGQGGQVTDLLMPHETRKVYIGKASEEVTEEEIKVKFSHYGTISFCRQFVQGYYLRFLVCYLMTSRRTVTQLLFIRFFFNRLKLH